MEMIKNISPQSRTRELRERIYTMHCFMLASARPKHIQLLESFDSAHTLIPPLRFLTDAGTRAPTLHTEAFTSIPFG